MPIALSFLFTGTVMPLSLCFAIIVSQILLKPLLFDTTRSAALHFDYACDSNRNAHTLIDEELKPNANA